MALNNKTKFGIAIAIAVLASLFSGLLALLLLALAACLIYWDREPKRVEEIVGGLPYGGQLLKGMARLDSILSSRDS